MTFVKSSIGGGGEFDDSGETARKPREIFFYGVIEGVWGYFWKVFYKNIKNPPPRFDGGLSHRGPGGTGRECSRKNRGRKLLDKFPKSRSGDVTLESWITSQRDTIVMLRVLSVLRDRPRLDSYVRLFNRSLDSYSD